MKIYKLYKNGIKLLFVSIFSLVLFALVIIDNKIQYLNGSIDSKNKYLILISIMYCFFYYFFLRNSKNYFKLNSNKIMLIYVIIFILQVIFAYSIYFYTGWDASTIRNTAFLIVEHPQEIGKQFFMYYSYFNYQTSIAVIIGYILRIFYLLNISNHYFMLVIFNVLIVNLSCLFTSLSIQKLFKNDKITIISIVIMLILLLFSPWIVIPYTDTFLLLFPSLVFYLYLFTNESDLDIFIWILIIILSIIGTLIKAQSIIILIALFIDKIIKTITVFKIKKVIHILILIFVIFLSIDLKDYIYTKLENNIDFNLVEGREFTYTHFLMTGLNPDTFGVFSDYDSSISYATGSVEEREKANWLIINQRLNDFGLEGYIDFSMNKILVNFNDGTFSWGGEGGFYVHIFDDKTIFSGFLKKIFYNDGQFYTFFVIVTQVAWLNVLMVLLLNIFNNKNNFKIEVLLTLIGLFLFIHIFEARARYLIGYLPIIILAFSFGLNELSQINLSKRK